MLQTGNPSASEPACCSFVREAKPSAESYATHMSAPFSMSNAVASWFLRDMPHMCSGRAPPVVTSSASSGSAGGWCGHHRQIVIVIHEASVSTHAWPVSPPRPPARCVGR